MRGSNPLNQNLTIIIPIYSIFITHH